ncbi:hypothetical protein C1645_766932 [Glomus cerebriforme]|uniref:SigF-like NTF2-like domain-containing protein n=1 Tax=Glomus cerebriforme TaxID=658196 RepID=A0A397SZV2_9GLOM|nr:hypothetical protein C1645_766932 [Glomus cerebriforme]
MDINHSDQIFPELIKDLLSYEEEKYNHVLKTYFTEDAVLTHPILNVEGRENIRKVFRVWTLLNKQPPEIINKDHLIFNGITAVVNVKQHLRPRLFPFLHFAVPSVTVLRFREGDDGLSYIVKQEDNWTLEGLIRSVPLINWWYENVVRVFVGNMVTSMGSFLATANIATSQLTIAANHIHQHGGDAVVQGQNRAYKYGSDLANNVTSVINRTKNSMGINFGTKGSENQYYITNGEATLETS